MRTVEAGELPPSLSVTSQLNHLRQRTTTPFHYHQTISLLVFREVSRLQPSPTLLSLSVCCHSFCRCGWRVSVSFVLLGPPPFRVFVLCRVWFCCWLCPSNKFSQWDYKIGALRLTVFILSSCFMLVKLKRISAVVRLMKIKFKPLQPFQACNLKY